MLNDFFKLNTPFQEFDGAQLAQHFKNSRDLRSVLYRPDDWPNAQLRQMKSATFSNVSLAKTNFKNCTFTNCKFEDCLFIGSNFMEVQFHRCKFTNCNFYKTKFENCYIDPRTISFDKVYRKKSANVGVHLYQQLFENSASTRQPTFEREADIEFRKWQRWQLSYDQESGKIDAVERYCKFIASTVYELATGFGYRPWRFIVTTLIVFTIISIVNMKLLPGSLRIENNIITRFSLPDAIFYTYSMLTVLGFSTIIPISALAKILAVTEALVGVGWLGLFTSILVKRFIR